MSEIVTFLFMLWPYFLHWLCKSIPYKLSFPGCIYKDHSNLDKEQQQSPSSDDRSSYDTETESDFQKREEEKKKGCRKKTKVGRRKTTKVTVQKPVDRSATLLNQSLSPSRDFQHVENEDKFEESNNQLGNLDEFETQINSRDEGILPLFFLLY